MSDDTIINSCEACILLDLSRRHTVRVGDHYVINLDSFCGPHANLFWKRGTFEKGVQHFVRDLIAEETA